MDSIQQKLMTDQPTTTLPAPVQLMREQLPVLLEKNVPLLEKWSARAHTALDSIIQVTSAEEREEAVAKLAAVRDVYNAACEKRKEMTEITDSFKDVVMEFERPFNPDRKQKNKYNEKLKFIEQYDQEQLEKRRREEAEATKRKEVENLKIDLKAKILQSLSNNTVETVKKADEYARTLFAALDINNFDVESEKFKKQKPKLKQETYDKCFEMPWNAQLMSKEEYGAFCTSVKEEETYEKWNLAVQEAVAPILNEWRAKIPDLKQELIARTNASEEEKTRLEAERKQRDEQEKQQRQTQLDLLAKENENKIQEDAQMGKMSNEFAAQAAVQNMEDAGAVKYVLKFTDPKLTPKAFANILYHCFSHKDFPGIVRRDPKTKKLMADDKGRPVYVEAVQWFIDFFLNNCDADIEGTQVFEDSKTVIRK